MNKGVITILVQFEVVVSEIMEKTVLFPKAARSTLGNRIDNLALDIVESLIEAKSAKGTTKRRIIESVGVKIEKLRVMLRVAYARRFLSISALEQLTRSLDETGRMLGGWARSEDEKARSTV